MWRLTVRCACSSIRAYPWYLRSGKCLGRIGGRGDRAVEGPAAALVCRFGAGGGPLRFRLSPDSAVSKRARKLATSASYIWSMNARSKLRGCWRTRWRATLRCSTREDAVEAASAVVEPVLKRHAPAIPYRRGSWGPKEADALIAPDGRWCNPRVCDNGAPIEDYRTRLATAIPRRWSGATARSTGCVFRILTHAPVRGLTRRSPRAGAGCSRRPRTRAPCNAAIAKAR